MESFESASKIDGSVEENEVLSATLQQFKKFPHSIKAATALIGVLGALSHEVNAEGMSDAEVFEAANKFEHSYREFSDEAKDAEWHGENTYIAQTDKESRIHNVIPEFPRSGSGVFEMNNASIISFGENVSFEGLTQHFTLDYPDDTFEIVPEGDKREITVELESGNAEQQILDALSNEITAVYGQEIELGGQEDHTKSLMSEDFKSHSELPIASWEITDVKTEDGQVTGYTISYQPGKVVETKE